MKGFKLTEDNDIAIENNDFVIIKGRELVEQLLKVNLQTFLGEVFTNLDVGVPYHQQIFVKGIPLSQIESVFKEAILDVYGVLDLISFDLSLNSETRKLSLSFSVQTDEGILALNGVEL